jgi:hypothetical protein
MNNQRLPEGKTCFDCVHIGKCFAEHKSVPKNSLCTFNPSRFSYNSGLNPGAGQGHWNDKEDGDNWK